MAGTEKKERANVASGKTAPVAPYGVVCATVPCYRRQAVCAYLAMLASVPQAALKPIAQ